MDLGSGQVVEAEELKNPLLARNLYPDFAQALNMPSEVGGVLA